jgi:hypothetical protein
MYDNLPRISQNPVAGFETYCDAHESMTVYLHDFVRFLGSLHPDPRHDLSKLQAVIEEHGLLTKRLTAWSQAFDKLIEQGPGASESDIAKLQIWRKAAELILALDICKCFILQIRAFFIPVSSLYFQSILTARF